MVGWEQADRRRHPRVAVHLDAGLELVGTGQAVAAVVEDASLEGVRLRCPGELAPGTQGFLVIEFPGRLPVAAMVEARGTSHGHADGTARAHLAIRRMSDASRVRLATLLAEQPGEV